MKPEIHIGAGLGGAFPFISYGTRGLDELVDAMSPDWDAHHHLQKDFEEEAYESIMESLRGPHPPKIVLIGHSMGVFRAIKVAWRLQSVGVPVDYLAAIDPTALTPSLKKELPTGDLQVPKNVKEVDEFWSGWGPINMPWYARAFAPDGSWGGKLVYTKEWLKRHHRRIRKVDAGHVPIASHRTTKREIISSVKGVVNG